MSTNTKRGLLALSLFLVLFPLATHKPGLPVTLKADEPAYYMMALSMAHDFDLVVELKDIRRGFDEYPYLPAKNFIMMTDNAWETTYYGKPFIYSLLAAPLARFFGANGLVSLNMMLLVGMLWMGISYLRRYNSDGMAALFTVGFFLLSNTFSYTFWLQPELFNMASGMLCLYLVFAQRPSDQPRTGAFAGLRNRLFQASTLPAWSGAALALSIYNKPVMLALALPVVLAGPKKDLIRRGLAFAAGSAIVFGLLSGFSILMTGHPSAYLGVARVGVTAESPSIMPVTPDNQEINRDDPKKNSWTWIFRIPTEFNMGAFSDDLRYFFWGRHTGLFPYQLFGCLAFILFCLNGPRSPKRWWVVASLASVALFFIIWIPFNWHGGGGFIGNRYFVNVYPGFLFLVTKIRPVSSLYVAYALGGLYLGPMLLTPFGAPVPEPTLQAHTRGAPYRILPLEFTIRSKIPGYQSNGHSGLGFLVRKDAGKVTDDSLWLQGANSVEVWITSLTPITTAIFEIENFAPTNEIAVKMSGDRGVLSFEEDAPNKQQISLAPQDLERVHDWRGQLYYRYKMTVDSATGEPTKMTKIYPEMARKGVPAEKYYVGAKVTYIGSPEIHAEDLYAIEWIQCKPPTEAIAGEAFQIPVVYRNRSEHTWVHDGPLRVSLSYHWLDEEGKTIVRDGDRWPLRRSLGSAKRMKDQQLVLAPETPGRYELVLDPVRERIAWFSDRNPGNECRAMIDVLPRPSSEESEGELVVATPDRSTTSER